MLYKTKGIVLNTINYNDKYVLVHILTELYGRVVYMVSKSKSKSSKVPKTLFSLFAVLDLEVDHHASREIQRINEARISFYLHDIAGNISKTSMIFFLSEFLSRVLRDVSDSKQLFAFLNHSIQILEMTENSVSNFHLVFMLKLSHFLGFYPNLEDYKEHSFFDMINGEYITRQPLHNHYLNLHDSRYLAQLSRMNYENMHHFVFSRNDRINIVNKILDYYKLHLYDFPTLKSLEVLHELF